MQVANPPAPEAPTDSPLRFGILGAATIAPIALVVPVKNHPDAVVSAVAARDQRRANAFAKKHGIPKAYGGPGSYQSALVYASSSVPHVDRESKSFWMILRLMSCITLWVGYFLIRVRSWMKQLTRNSLVSQLPNGLHYEWTMKALAAGKHVLLEKPSANTAEETRRMFAFAQEKRLVLLEAFHYR